MSLPSSKRSPISCFVSNMRIHVRMPASHFFGLGFGFELQLRCCFEQLCAQTARGVSSPGSQYTLLPLITHRSKWLDYSPYSCFFKGLAPYERGLKRWRECTDVRRRINIVQVPVAGDKSDGCGLLGVTGDAAM